MKGLDAPNGAIAYANATAMTGRLKDSRMESRIQQEEGTAGGRDSGPHGGRGIAAHHSL